MELSTQAFLWGIASAISLPLGAVLGLWLRPKQKISSCLTAFGAGALLFALTIELFGHVPHHVDNHGLGALAASVIGAIAGGLLFHTLNHILNNRGAFLRRLSHARRHVAHLHRLRTKKLVEELGRFKILSHIRPQDMADLIQRVRKQRFRKGQVIFRQGDKGEEMYFIVSGTVEIARHRDNTQNDDRILLQDHEVFGELALLHDAPRNAEARALTDVHVYKINKADFDEVLAVSPRLAKAILELADTRVDELNLKNSGVHDRQWKDETLVHLDGLAHPVSNEDIRQEGEDAAQGGAGLAIWLGIFIDGIPESFVIGMLTISSVGMSLAFIAGVFLANLPEAMSSALGMRQTGMGVAKIMWMWGSICIITGLGAFLGATFFPAHPEGALFLFVLAIEGLAAGAMLTMIAETMMPEAFEHGGPIVGLSTLAGFLVTLTVKVL